MLYESSMLVIKAENYRAVSISEVVIVFLDCTPNSGETGALCF